MLGGGHSSLKNPHAGTSGGGEVSETHVTLLVMVMLYTLHINIRLKIMGLNRKHLNTGLDLAKNQQNKIVR